MLLRRKLGREFMPDLDEQSLMDMPTTVPRASIAEVERDLRVRDAILRGFPEVWQVVGKAGRAETPTDTAPLDMIETIINLRDHNRLAQAEAAVRRRLGPDARSDGRVGSGGNIAPPALARTSGRDRERSGDVCRGSGRRSAPGPGGAPAGRVSSRAGPRLGRCGDRCRSWLASILPRSTPNLPVDQRES